MFPGAGAQVYYNEAGEPLGWDYPSYDDQDLDRYIDQHIDQYYEIEEEEEDDEPDPDE